MYCITTHSSVTLAYWSVIPISNISILFNGIWFGHCLESFQNHSFFILSCSLVPLLLFLEPLTYCQLVLKEKHWVLCTSETKDMFKCISCCLWLILFWLPVTLTRGLSCCMNYFPTKTVQMEAKKTKKNMIMIVPFYVMSFSYHPS